MPRPKLKAPELPAKRVPSAAELAARARVLKPREGMAEQFGITPGPDPPRELVAVAELPDPPRIEAAISPRANARAPEVVNVDEAVMIILREEMEELGARLARFGIGFTPGMRQDMIDHAFALLGGFVQGGGAISSR